jgi:alpha-galactosidase
MATYGDTYNKMRWYTERDRLAIVQVDAKAKIVDDTYTNIPAGSTVRIYGAKIAEPFSLTNEELEELPEQYHEAIVYKAIATGYETPPNLNPEMAMYFKTQYATMVKDAKKWKKLGRVGGFQQLVPKDF